MTLDVIGLTGTYDLVSSLLTILMFLAIGFNYKFNALNDNGKPDELSQAFARVFSSSTKPSMLLMLQARIPLLRWIVCIL